MLSVETRVQEVDISIVLPCLNESATLAKCIEDARSVILGLGVSGEIIVADNGSTDGSQAIARQMGARLIEVSRRGYGAALMVGCQLASGKYIIMADSDASYDLREAVPMITKLKAGFDLIVGSRLKGEILPGAMPWKNRYIGNPALTGLLNVFYHSGLSDAHCGLRAFTREAFERMDLHCVGMEFASEMIVKATLLGMRRSEIPITYYPDGRNRSSNLRPWRDGWRHLRLMLLFSPRWLYMTPGILALFVSVVLNTVLTLMPEPTYLTLGRLFFGTHWTVPATLGAILGLQSIFLGVIVALYSVQRGLYPSPGWLDWITRHLSLETGLGVGALLGLAGFTIEAVILVRWVLSAFGPLAEFRLAMYGLMWIMMGAEFTFNSFVLGLLSNELDTFSPDKLEAGMPSGMKTYSKSS